MWLANTHVQGHAAQGRAEGAQASVADGLPGRETNELAVINRSLFVEDKGGVFDSLVLVLM
jgi:hypothetical protein